MLTHVTEKKIIIAAKSAVYVQKSIKSPTQTIYFSFHFAFTSQIFSSNLQLMIIGHNHNHKT